MHGIKTLDDMYNTLIATVISVAYNNYTIRIGDHIAVFVLLVLQVLRLLYYNLYNIIHISEPSSQPVTAGS